MNARIQIYSFIAGGDPVGFLDVLIEGFVLDKHRRWAVAHPGRFFRRVESFPNWEAARARAAEIANSLSLENLLKESIADAKRV